MYMTVLAQQWDNRINMTNVFFYRNSAGIGSAAGLNANFISNVLPKINAFQNGSVANKLLRTIHLFDLEDFGESELSGDGDVAAGGSLPSVIAVNFTLRLDTRAVRPGKKRFSGLAEDSVTLNLITETTVLTALNTLRVQLGTVLNAGGGIEYTPCVVKRIEEVDPETGKSTYRLPVTESELVYGNVVTVLLNTTVTTQRSRRA